MIGNFVAIVLLIALIGLFIFHVRKTRPSQGNFLGNWRDDKTLLRNQNFNWVEDWIDRIPDLTVEQRLSLLNSIKGQLKEFASGNPGLPIA